MNDRYRLHVPLGAYGMGTAWLAYDELLARDVLAQELPVPAGTDPAEWREHVIERIGAVDAIRNAPVAVVHDLVTADDDRLWTITGLEDGTSLAQVLADQRRLPVEQVAALGLEALAALTAAHRRGLVHGAVTPATVVINGDGRVKLAGFGGGGRTGAFVGVPGFTAPECLTGPPVPASDLWSLGATLYAAVEGVPPYRRATALATTSTTLTGRPREPAHAGPLAPLLEALLGKDPLTRPRPRTISSRLRRIAAGRPVREPLVVPRSVVAAVVACSVVLACGAGVLGARVKAGADAERAANSRGSFVRVPVACGLLTDAQFAALVPAPTIDDEETTGPNPAVCRGDTALGAGVPEGLKRRVKLVLQHHPPAELAGSRELFRRESEDARTRVGGTGHRPLPGLGDEAYTYQLRDSDRLSQVVMVRVSNVVAEIVYSGRIKDDPEGRLAAGGLRAARWVADALARRA
ncbi:protein kinase domain-containing protein [Nonomuraea cavernae]|uniref:Protein kinase domain-containing protein n=1 Tax=Nonomuraea cavernae TaxID=2045107 RepID=A0A917YZ03_9ACTN|nr:hypothetical protein [Nonomuraea cavernae]MCA2186138.1 hypothetical protein [Nonomuraea cavernae]GGO70099.1 hypothetical protein GCM10012289_32750 [Nonomuraea cavernae]